MTAPSPHARCRHPAGPPGAGRRAWQLIAGTIRFLGRLLRGVIAVAALAALVGGLPWALVHYIGWPLPQHIPTWPELQGFLLSPMTTTFLLDFLACACWVVWAAFTLDVLRCIVEVARSARWPDLSAAGPMHTLAAVLVGAVLVSVLGNRSAPMPSGPPSSPLGMGSPVVASAPAWQHPAPAGRLTMRSAVVTTPETESPTSASGGASEPVAPSPVSVIVRAPTNGVHDSLWRIAQRALGDGARWPEIFHANEGKPQPGGGRFTNPNLVYPFEELALPPDAHAPSAPPAGPPEQHRPVPPPVSTTAPPSSTSPPATSAPSTSAAPAITPSVTAAPPARPGRPPSISWGPDVFVGLGLAAAVSAALAVARRRYRARYQPGSGDRDDFPVAPVVYQLRLAHLRAQQADDDGDDEDTDLDHAHPAPAEGAEPFVVGDTAPGEGTAAGHRLTPVVGVRDGREIALNLAQARGLGVVGPGAPAAARAVLLAVMTARQHTAAGPAVRVIVPAEDLPLLLGRDHARSRLPATVQVADSLDAALDELDVQVLHRARAENTAGWPPLVVVARPSDHAHRRLQAVLDNGSVFGVLGVLLGQWRPGLSAYVRTDGTISATSPGLAEALRGTSMFRLGDAEVADLLALLHHPQPAPAPVDEDALPPVLPRPRAGHAAPATTATPVPCGVTETPGHRAAPQDTLDTPGRTGTDTDLEILRQHHADASHSLPGLPTSTNPRWALAVENERIDTATTHAAAHGPGSEPGRVSAPALSITALGMLRVHWHPDPAAGETSREITGALQPRMRELLVLLALHPDGVTREALVAALWAQDPPARPTNVLHTTVSRLRAALAAATDGALPDVVSTSSGRYQFDPAYVDVDYWRFAAAVTARRTAVTDADRVAAYRQIVDSAGGPLADGMAAEWIQAPREAIRRDAIDAVGALARALVADDPQQTLDLLEVARAFDPHNEKVYRDIMRLQARLGLIDAIPRTLGLLTTRLAELDDRPTAAAVELVARLRQRHDSPDARPVKAAVVRERGDDRHGRNTES